MFENRVLRWAVYGASTALLSEAVYWLYKRARDLWQHHYVTPEVAEVIWTNELTQNCTGQHQPVNRQPPLSPRSFASGGGPVPRSPAMNNNAIICRNPYCAVNNFGRLIALIDASRYTIDLAMYTFTSYDLSQAFIRAVRRGVSVRIISDREMAYSSGSQITTLSKGGVPVRCPVGTTLMHHKFCILDGQTRACNFLAHSGRKYDTKNVRGIIMSGSLNWTMQGFGGNWENILITSNKLLVKQFETEFQRMWIAFEDKTALVA